MSEEREAEDRDEGEAEPSKPAARVQDLLGRRDSPLREVLDKLWDTIKRGYEDQYDRVNDCEDRWDAYNCILNQNQYYDGTAEIFVPIIHDAVEAIVTRISNQLCPEGSHWVDIVTDDPTGPDAIRAMLNKYLIENEANTSIVKTLLTHGLIEGQLNLYVDWDETAREIVSRETRGPTIEIGGEEIPVPGEDIEDRSTEEIIEQRPDAEVLHDNDVLVLPVTARTIDKALAAGGCVVICRRYSKAKIQDLKDAGIFNKTAAEELIAAMEAQARNDEGSWPDLEKRLLEQVGIRKKGSEATVWQVFKMLPLNDKGKYSKDGKQRILEIFLSGSGGDRPTRLQLGCHRNRFWNDRVPLISKPLKKIGGMFKGGTPVQKVLSLQYEANDAANEGADMSHMSACGLILRDPQFSKQALIMNIGAVWDVPPDSVRFAEFPDLTPRAAARIQFCIGQIFQTLGVNPSMLPQQTSTARRNQAQIAQDQQVDLLTTSESAKVMVSVLTDMLSLWVDFDYQFRDRETSAMLYGILGQKAVMQAVPPQLNRSTYQFKWVGVEKARNAMTQQQKIAWINVARGLEPVLAQAGYRLNLAMPIEESAIDLWGPHNGPKVIQDTRAQLSMDPEQENLLMREGHEVPVSIMDDDQRHLALHQREEQQFGDPHQIVALHKQWHTAQMARKQQAQMMQQQAGGQPPPGGPPGAQPQPGRGGGPPRPGAMPQGPQLVKGPPGQIHPDQMPRAGAVLMPRRM